MKHIHAAYLKSLDVEDLAKLSSGNKDPEFFLPKHSPLRSEKGELLRPAGRGPFDSYEAFKVSTEVGFWLEMFLDSTGRFDVFNELGRRIVSEVCMEQSTKEVRVSSGPKLLGYDKREHVSPLALCMHEIKIWAAEVLPLLHPGDHRTYRIIAQRIKFLVGLTPRDVWGRLRRTIGHGAHGKLVLLLQRLIMLLTQANKAEFKRYCQRQLHNKLGRLQHAIRAVVAQTCTLAAGLGNVDEKLSTDKLLQLSDMTDGSLKECRTNFSNMIAVCLYYTCKAPLLRGGLSSDFSAVPEDEVVPVLKGWATSNPWAKRGAISPTPEYSVSLAYSGIPNAYSAAYDTLYADLRGASRYVVWPLTMKSVAAKWKAAFVPDPKDVLRPAAINALQAHLAALHDVGPCMYVIHRVWEMCSNDDVLCMDCLRPQLIRLMGDVLLRLACLRSTELNALHTFTELASKQLATQGRLEDAAKLLVNGPGIQRAPGNTIKPVKSLVDPVFLQNLDFVAAEIAPSNQQIFGAAFHLAQEIARDVFDYALAPPTIVVRGGLQASVAPARAIMQLCETLNAIRAEDYHGSFNLARVSLALGADWLLMRTFYLAALEEVSKNNFEDMSEPAGFKAQEDECQRELESISAQNAGQDDVSANDALEDQMMKIEEEIRSEAAASGGGGSSSAAQAAMKKKGIFGRLSAKTSSQPPGPATTPTTSAMPYAAKGKRG